MGLTTQTFDIITRLAIGNGALVYRAVEKTSLRQVALKLLTQDGEIDHRLDLDALFADAPRIKSIYGAHVCQLLDAYADDDGPVLVYEFANGLNGAEFPHQRKLDATQALDIAAQLISALRSGERQRMPHGDLKPSNIIFVDLPDGRPFTFVLDWGLAAYRQALPDDSLFYLAPERLAGQPPSHAADLFAAGAVLFYLYTGKVLVAGGSHEQVAAAWRNVRPSVLAELRPDLSPKLVQWICSLMELDPARRPASAVEASTTLAALNPPPPAAPPESIRPRPAKAEAPAPTRLPVPAATPSSVIMPVPQRSGVRPAVQVPTPRPAAPVLPPKKSVLPAILLGALTALALGGGGWYWVRNRDKTPSPQPASAADAKPARTPSPSVTAPVPTLPPRSLPGAIAEAKPNSKAAEKPVAKASAPSPATPPVTPATSPVAEGGGGLLAHEPFAYNTGANLGGSNGGTGWAGAWQGDAGTIDSKSLPYAKLPSSGGSLFLAEAGHDVILSRAAGSASRFIPDPKKGGYWYFAVMLDHRSALPKPGGDIQFNPFNTQDAHKLIRIVVSNAGDSTRIVLNSESQAVEVKNDKPVCILARIEAKNPKFDNYDINVKLWVNPDFTATKRPKHQLEHEVKYQPLPPQAGIMIRKKRGDTVSRVDDIRFGLHWADVAFLKDDKSDD